jgi:hypothetical protein
MQEKEYAAARLHPWRCVSVLLFLICLSRSDICRKIHSVHDVFYMGAFALITSLALVYLVTVSVFCGVMVTAFVIN